MQISERQQLVERLEEVVIEQVHVGDYVCSSTTSHAEPLCVLAKAPIRSPDLARVVGWQIELANGSTLWLPRGALVERRRFQGAPAAAPKPTSELFRTERAFVARVGRLRPSRAG